MEIETDIAHVYTSVGNLPINLEAANTVSIYINEVIDDQITGNVTHLRSDHIRLNPRRGFTRHHDLSRLLGDQQVPESQFLGARINHDIELTLARNDLLREPVFVSVNVIFIKERRLILPPPRPPPSRGAPRGVFQILAEEQSVEPKDLGEKIETRDQCSICIEGFSKSSHENIIEMPPCLHMFHQKCLFEWLRRQNSCPLCRRVPYE